LACDSFDDGTANCDDAVESLSDFFADDELNFRARTSRAWNQFRSG